MGYVLPRAVIVLIAWGTTCLIMHSCTTVAPLIFYIAGGVWALVGLIALVSILDFSLAFSHDQVQ